MSSSNTASHISKKYYPPAHDVLVHFARQVGDELGEDYADPDIVADLADFMSTVAKVLASDLNRKRGGEFDT